LTVRIAGLGLGNSHCKFWFCSHPCPNTKRLADGEIHTRQHRHLIFKSSSWFQWFDSNVSISNCNRFSSSSFWRLFTGIWNQRR